MSDQIKLAIARALYSQDMIAPNWDLEQDHLKYSYFEHAERILSMIDGMGMELCDKPKVALESDGQEPQVSDNDKILEREDLDTKFLPDEIKREVEERNLDENVKQEGQGSKATKRRSKKDKANL